jgi:two-component system cell cycle sensor histidine kinase PleC
MRSEPFGERDALGQSGGFERAPLVADSPAGPVLRPVAELGEHASLHAALEQLVLLIEHQVPAMRGSILLLDDDGVTLRHGAAPHLPPDYRRAIDGERIGPAAGSCGTAAYRGEQVVVSDIATDPLWEDHKDAALSHGLRACWSTPIMDSEGKVLGTFAMYYDEPRLPAPLEQALTATATMLASNIIVRIRAEAALRESQEQLRERIEVIERSARALAASEARARAARAEAEHANKVKSDFLAMMSHELRTPLNAIGGYAKLMLEGIPDPATEGQQNSLRRIVRAQEHLLNLIEAVLAYAKLEAGRMTYRMTNIRVGELLDTIETLVRPQVAAKKIAYECGSCAGSLVMRGDKQKTVQILLNILSNAVKFTLPGGGSRFGPKCRRRTASELAYAIRASA